MNLKNFNIYVYITEGVLLLLSLVWLIYSMTNYLSIRKDKVVKRKYISYALWSMLLALIFFILILILTFRTYKLLEIEIPKINRELSQSVNSLLTQVKSALEKSYKQNNLNSK